MKNLTLLVLITLISLSAHSQQFDWNDDAPQLTSFVQKNEQRLISHLIDSYKKSSKYRPRIEQIFISHNVPTELYAVASIESNFSPNSISHAGAVGMWQIMKGTAGDLNLTVNDKIDERRNWEKSTFAAAKYLKYMAEELFYGDYELAILAYNAGPGRVMRAIERNNTNNPWKLIEKEAGLPKESREYLPKVVAAIHVFNYIESKEQSIMAQNK